MSRALLKTERLSNLRLEAISQLTGKLASAAASPSSTGALEVLYKLASSPATAPEALALLHELQVHQVELEIQAEELNRFHGESESVLFRMTQLYDFAPVGCFTVDRNTTLIELNLTGAHLLGSERDALLGRALITYLTLPSAQGFWSLLAKAGEGYPPEGCILELMAGETPGATVFASVEPDPAGENFLVAFTKVAEK